MDINLSQLADNSMYYLYLADTGQHIKSDHVQIQKYSLGLIRFLLFPGLSSLLPQHSKCFYLKLSNDEETKGFSFLSHSSVLRVSSFTIPPSLPLQKAWRWESGLRFHCCIRYRALHQLEPFMSCANAHSRNQCDTTAWNEKTVLGIGIKFGEGNLTMHLHRHESGLISFANDARAAALITAPFNFPLWVEVH